MQDEHSPAPALEPQQQGPQRPKQQQNNQQKKGRQEQFAGDVTSIERDATRKSIFKTETIVSDLNDTVGELQVTVKGLQDMIVALSDMVRDAPSTADSRIDRIERVVKQLADNTELSLRNTQQMLRSVAATDPKAAARLAAAVAKASPAPATFGRKPGWLEAVLLFLGVVGVAVVAIWWLVS